MSITMSLLSSVTKCLFQSFLFLAFLTLSLPSLSFFVSSSSPVLTDTPVSSSPLSSSSSLSESHLHSLISRGAEVLILEVDHPHELRGEYAMVGSLFGPKFKEVISSSPSSSQFSKVEIIVSSPLDGCYSHHDKWLSDHDDYRVADGYTKVLLIERGYCNFTEKIHYSIEHFHPALSVILSGYVNGNDNDDSEEEARQLDVNPLIVMKSAHPQYSKDIHIPSAMISQLDGEGMLHHWFLHHPVRKDINGKHIYEMDPKYKITGKIHLYQPKLFDFSFIFVFIIALFTISMGSYLSSLREREISYKIINQLPLNTDGERHFSHSSLWSSSFTHYVSSKFALVFVVFSSFSLIILFYFISEMMQLVVNLFFFLSLYSLTVLTNLILFYIFPPYYNKSILQCTNGSNQQKISLSRFTFISLILALFLSVFWFLTRKDWSGSFILQNLCNSAILILLMKTIRLPSAKIATVLLLSALSYDVFWVFISPYLFSSSVMTTVSLGGDSGESLPFMIKFPRLSDNLKGNYNFLGVGDILFPGLFICFLLRFDLFKKMKLFKNKYMAGEVFVMDSKESNAIEEEINDIHFLREHNKIKKCLLTITNSYFALGLFTYSLGIALTYMAIIFTNASQPAMFYVVPPMLICVLYVGWKKNDGNEIWNGYGEIQQENKQMQDNQYSTREQEQEEGKGQGVSSSSSSSLPFPLGFSSFLAGRSKTVENVGLIDSSSSSSSSSSINTKDNDMEKEQGKHQKKSKKERERERERESEMASLTSSSSSPSQMERNSRSPRNGNAQSEDEGVLF